MDQEDLMIKQGALLDITTLEKISMATAVEIREGMVVLKQEEIVVMTIIGMQIIATKEIESN